MDTATLLQDQGLTIDQAIVFLDREQGGKAILSEAGINAKCVTNITTLMAILLKHGRVKQDIVDKVMEFVNNNKAKSKMPGMTIYKCVLG